jgi:hypothetical protein
MKTTFNLLIILFLCCGMGLLASCGQQKEGQQKETNVLLIVGEHSFDEESFYAMMDKLPGITYNVAEHPDAYQYLKPEKIEGYDAVLLYDMPAEIPEDAKKDFIAMLEKGTGLVVLHHAFCSYDFWPEYTNIVGGRYHHFPWQKDGEEQPPSTYKHDLVLNVKVVDSKHPVTKGISDFQIVDEAYGGTEILESVHPLLATDEPASAPLVGWTNHYANAKVVTLTLGHDKQAWENPVFSQLLSQAISWVGDR